MEWPAALLRSKLEKSRLLRAGIRVEPIPVTGPFFFPQADLLVANYCEGPVFDWVSGYKPHGNSNKELLTHADSLLWRAGNVPVLAGICPFDPFTPQSYLLEQVQKKGFCGIQNFPTVGLCDGYFRANLERAGITFEQDVLLVKEAHEAGLFTLPFVFQAEEARQMAEAGADGIVVHFGLDPLLPLSQCIQLLHSIIESLQAYRNSLFLLCCGEPLRSIQDIDPIYSLVDGLYGLCHINNEHINSYLFQDATR